MVSREFLDEELNKTVYQVSFVGGQSGVTNKVEKVNEESVERHSKQKFKPGRHGKKQFFLQLDMLKPY